MLIRPVDAWHLAYLLVADAPLRYPKGRSRIAYIGNTYTGLWRLTSSTAERAKSILKKPGVSHFEVYPVRSDKRRGLRTWQLLESNLLHTFRETYGELPLCNRRGGRPSSHFEPRAIARIICRFDAGSRAA
jgi:hypothetical protein